MDLYTLAEMTIQRYLLNFSASLYFSIACRLCFLLCSWFPSNLKRVASNTPSNDFSSMSCKITFILKAPLENGLSQWLHFFASCFSKHNLQNEWPHETVTGSKRTPVQMPHCKIMVSSLAEKLLFSIVMTLMSPVIKRSNRSGWIVPLLKASQ